MPTDKPNDALPDQLQQVELDLARLAMVLRSASHPLGAAEPAINRLEQDRPAVGAGALGVELGYHNLVEVEAQLRDEWASFHRTLTLHRIRATADCYCSSMIGARKIRTLSR